MSEDGRLLRQYRDQGSQAAFARLAARHLGFVYATCLRETGDAAQAEDAAQVVFLLLARKAPALRPEQSLSGWLFQTARFVARNARRREARRRAWEERAMEQTPAPGQEENALWDRLSPAVNDALAALGAKDREAVLLRFADGLSFPELGVALGTSEDAARMRLNRALGRLRRFFAKQGVTLSVAVLIGLLAERTVQVAPDSCAAAVAKIAGSIAAGAGSAVSISPEVQSHLQGALQAMTTTKITLAAACVLVASATVLPLTTLAQSHAKSRAKNQPRSHAKSAAVKSLQQSAPSDAFPDLQLRDGFTLHYTVVATDVRTPEEKAAEQRNMAETDQRLVRRGVMKQADADADAQRRKAIDELPATPEQRLVTLSSRDGKLLYISRQVGAHSHGLDANRHSVLLPYEKKVVLYDGRKTYTLLSNDSYGSLLQIDLGFRSLYMMDCLLPGVGLPAMPLARVRAPESAPGTILPPAAPAQKPGDAGLPCDVFTLNGGLYKPGLIYMKGKGRDAKLTRMIVGQHDHPTEVWEFQSPQAFQGGWLSRHAYNTDYGLLSAEDRPLFSPVRAAEYRITGTQKTPLVATRFDIRSYLVPNTSVEDHTAVQSGLGPHRFLYNPNGGDLEAQSRAATSR